jgi:hypothetical protein
MLAGQHSGKFHLIHPLRQGRQQLPYFIQRFLILALFSQFHQDLQVFQLAGSLLPLLYNLLQAGTFFQEFLGFIALIPEAGARNLCL